MINACPFTHVQDDVDGISYALSPSHLIYGRRIADTPNDSYFDISSTYSTLTKRYKTQKHLLNQFTNQWRKDYLTRLRELHCTNSQQRGTSDIKVGDVAAFKDDSTKKAFRKLGLIDELITGRDGKIRAALVLVGSSDDQACLLKRSILHLYPVELKN